MIRQDWHCIEFLKTVGWQARDRDDDEFEEFGGVVEWARRRGIINPEGAGALLALAEKRGTEASAALARVRRTRDLLHAVLTRKATGVPVDPGHLEELNAMVQDASRSRRLIEGPGGFTWIWTADPDRFDGIIAPVIWSATELLTSPEVERLRRCDADDCGWLFIDGSRNRSRRWCDMADCGNLEKVRRFRARQRG